VVRVLVKEIVDHSVKVDMSWRDFESIYHITNTLLIGYQTVLWKVLGRGMGAMEQLLIREFGEMLAELTNHLERRESGQSLFEKHGVEDLEVLIKAYLEKLGIARDVKVEKLEAIEKYGRLLERFKIEIRDSVFLPTHIVLRKRGIEEFPLSPEGLLIAAVIKRALQHGRGDESVRVKVDAFLPEREGDPLVVIVEEVHPLR